MTTTTHEQQQLPSIVSNATLVVVGLKVVIYEVIASLLL
jgi:hypothetical protein